MAYTYYKQQIKITLSFAMQQIGWLVTSLFSTNMAMSETNVMQLI